MNDITGKDIDCPLGELRQGAAVVEAERTLGSAGVVQRRARATATTRSAISAALRAKPFHAFRSIEGFTHRNIRAQTVQRGLRRLQD